ncbi:hypothetical protein DFH29DRAFT_1084501 [Suillus ampliporus]|nr:hypothetical protein DFH29DRAFT_1084501 [Suillus ampliporus]
MSTLLAEEEDRPTKLDDLNLWLAHHPAEPALFVLPTYLSWLPRTVSVNHSTLPLLLRTWPPPDTAEDQPHPLHACIEPFLSLANKYHNELPQILANSGGAGEAEQSLM